MILLGKKNLLGVNIDALDYEGAASLIIDAAKKSQSFSMSALAVHGVMTGVLDKEHRYRLNQFDLITPDGQPVRLALNLLYGTKLPDRVYGPYLTWKICELASIENLPIYMYGSKNDTLVLLAENLKKSFPGIIIAGMQPSRFKKVTKEEKAEIISTINNSGAKILLVGLGCPRQEVWVYEHKNLINMPMMAVGAAFDFHAGTLSMAPRIMQDFSLEWLYRLIQEPKRLWRRYLILNPHYLWLLLLQFLGIKKRTIDECIKPTEELLFG